LHLHRCKVIFSLHHSSNTLMVISVLDEAPTPPLRSDVRSRERRARVARQPRQRPSHANRGQTPPRPACSGRASSGLPEMHFSFVKRTLHPTRIISTKKRAVHTSHNHTPRSHPLLAAMQREPHSASCPTWSWVCIRTTRCRYRCTSFAARIS
jgi:hypothetical protein